MRLKLSLVLHWRIAFISPNFTGLYITRNEGSNDIQSSTLDNLPDQKTHQKLTFKLKMIAFKILFCVVCIAVAMASEESEQVAVKENEDLKTEETHIGGYGLGDGIYGVNQFNNGHGLGYGGYGNGLGLGGYGGIGAGYRGIGAGYGGIGGAYGGVGAYGTGYGGIGSGYGGIGGIHGGLGAYGAGYGGIGAYGGVGAYGGIGGYGTGYGANHKNAHGHGHNQGHSSYESVNKVSSHQSHNSAAGGHHSANHALGGARY
ncbi:glycine-rich cell wall structural protein 1.0 isoform X1 [Daphnia magna]|uniref:glycine-rich cell wall structural protein 1.0 isoform X1 n=1 Tax=Daphnia magna TaxID=35525 RepID=UPI001E1BC4CF|nr:glycine-rich cell wall structural protein 1.0 isoform X1 [Daphnia magna]